MRWSEGSSDDGQIESNSGHDRDSVGGNFKFSFAANIQQHNLVKNQSKDSRNQIIKNDKKSTNSTSKHNVIEIEKEYGESLQSQNLIKSRDLK